MIPQPHGGALSPRYSGTASRNPRTPWKLAKQEIIDAISPTMGDSALELARLATSAEDERVRVVAIKQQWDMLREALAPDGEADGSPMDVSHLSPDQLGELMAAMATIRRLTARSDVVDV